MNLSKLLKIQENLKGRVEQEYTNGYNHIRPLLDEKRDVLSRVLLRETTKGKVRENLVWKNIQLEKALFLTDDLDIQVLTNGGVLGEEIMKNANLVLKYDDLDSCGRDMREQIIDDNAYYGLSATIIDGWDDDEVQPLSGVISPLNLIIDPKNYNSSKMRYIGVRRRLPLFSLMNNESFNKNQVNKAKDIIDAELSKIENNINNSTGQTTITDNEGMIDVYDHFTIYNGNKVLTTWGADRSVLLRYLEIEPLTKAEQLKPTKVKYPIQLHRRKPVYGRVTGASIVEEVGTFQDAITKLLNLQLKKAQILELGNDVFMDKAISFDPVTMAKKDVGGRIIQVSNKNGMPVQNGIYQLETAPPNQYVTNLMTSLQQKSEETTNISKQMFGNSQNGNQTKAEIQTLQQNANNLISRISSNYLKGQKEYWTEYYRTYALNMPKGAKKSISMFQKGKAISLELKKDDFIADGKVSITIISKSQERIENEAEFNKITFLINTYLPNIKGEYPKNELLRLLGKKSNIKDFNPNIYIRETPDELRAKENLLIINNDLGADKVFIPTYDNDLDIYYDIYNQGMNNETKQEVMRKLTELIYEKERLMGTQENVGVGNNAVANMAMNNINQTSNQMQPNNG